MTKRERRWLGTATVTAPREEKEKREHGSLGFGLFFDFFFFWLLIVLLILKRRNDWKGLILIIIIIIIIFCFVPSPQLVAKFAESEVPEKNTIHTRKLSFFFFCF